MCGNQYRLALVPLDAEAVRLPKRLPSTVQHSLAIELCGGLDIDNVGARKPGSRSKDMLLATCLHDLEGISYGVITKMLHTKLWCSDK